MDAHGILCQVRQLNSLLTRGQKIVWQDKRGMITPPSVPVVRV